jgi:hypothetical protein
VKEQTSWTYDLRKKDDPRSSVCSMVGTLSFVEEKNKRQNHVPKMRIEHHAKMSSRIFCFTVSMDHFLAVIQINGSKECWQS